MKRWFLRILVVVGVLMLALVTYAILINEERPTVVEGDADALARKVQQAVQVEAWEGIPAISWVFGGRHELLWDKQRGFIRVRWEDVEVVRALSKAEGVATRGGQAVDGEDKAELLREAYAHWVNDAFWLYPFRTFFQPGVTRELARNEDGEQGLFVSYPKGGVTPGDAYLWHVGDDGMPTAWQMWVEILPIGGIRVTWEDWTDVLGAKVATAHQIGPLPLAITDVRAGDLSTLEPGPDPFAALAELSLPTSQPTR